jgi:hypothetical protein
MSCKKIFYYNMEDYSEIESELSDLILIYGEKNNVKLIPRKDFYIWKSDVPKMVWSVDNLEKPSIQQLKEGIPILNQYKRNKKKAELQMKIEDSDLFPLFKEMMKRLDIQIEDLNID